MNFFLASGIVPYCLIVIAAMTAGVAIGMYGVIGAGAIAALIVLTAGVIRPKEATHVALAFGLLQFLFTKSYPILPLGVSGLDDVLLVGILVRSILDLLARRRTLNAPVVFLACILWIICAIMTGLARGVDVLTMALAFRGIALPITLLLAGGLYFNKSHDRERLRGIVILAGSFHAALSIIQWAVNPTYFDVGFGVLGPGGANAAGFLDLMTLLFLLSRPLAKRHYLIAALLIIAPITSSARAAIYIMPLSLLVLFISRKSISKGVAQALSLASIVGLFLWGYSLIKGSGLEELVFRQLIEEQLNPGQGGRLLYIMALPRVLGDDILLWLFGVGPGAFTSYVGIKAYATAFITVAPIKNDIATGFTYAYPDIQWAALIGEYGLIGTIAVLVILFAPLHRWLKQLGGIVASGDVTVAYPATVVVLFTAFATMNVLEYQPLSYIYWTIIGLVYSYTSENTDNKAAAWEYAP